MESPESESTKFDNDDCEIINNSKLLELFGNFDATNAPNTHQTTNQ